MKIYKYILQKMYVLWAIIFTLYILFIGEENRKNQATWGQNAFDDMNRMATDGCNVDDITIFAEWYV